MNNPMNIMQMLPQFRANFPQLIAQRRLNIPQNMMNNPDAIVNHLLQTRQISQDAVNRAYQQLSQFRR